MVGIINFEKKAAAIDETTGRDRLFSHLCLSGIATHGLSVQLCVLEKV
jgi:hypothetical protein